MNFRYIKSLWGKVCPLDRALWGNYHKYHKRTPLCIVPDCKDENGEYKRSVYRHAYTGYIEYFCEYHEGQIGALRDKIRLEAIEMIKRWQIEQQEDEA